METLHLLGTPQLVPPFSNLYLHRRPRPCHASLPSFRRSYVAQTRRSSRRVSLPYTGALKTPPLANTKNSGRSAPLWQRNV